KGRGKRTLGRCPARDPFRRGGPMSRFARLSVVLALGAAGLAPSPAAAQLVGGPLPALPGVGGVAPLGGIRPLSPLPGVGMPGLPGVGGVSPLMPVRPLVGTGGVSPLNPVAGYPTFNYVQSWQFQVGPLSYSR